ncbi:hypothetical protein GCM10028806_33740 [Spirosoma terrae]|uniref:Uncharacterized protein n=1 Tax=Spirosoma terrae TaxID=1968276 RepID=A0A6L9L558_9BACT|nr:hypothetical protein [Spirosoma terrae]NDU95686.1 hypothetical protein [Spirosoma terrae]
MPQYIIPCYFEFHGKVAVEADTLEEAVEQVTQQQDLNGDESFRKGNVSDLHFTEHVKLDTPGITEYNSQKFPGEVEAFKKLSLDQLKELFGSDHVE